MTNEQIIKEELQKVVDEAKEIYNGSGKRSTGNWEKGLEIKTSLNKGELYGYAYLAGRRAGKQPPTASILEWIKAKGIRPENGMKLSALAYLIARKIGREGTDKSRHLKVFEEILTPQRIQSIIDKVSQFNVGMFVNDITVEFNKLSKV